MVLCSRSQETRLVGRALYSGGDYSADEILLRHGIEVIYRTFTLYEYYLPVLEVDCEEIIRGVEGHKVVLIHDG